MKLSSSLVGQESASRGLLVDSWLSFNIKRSDWSSVDFRAVGLQGQVSETLGKRAFRCFFFLNQDVDIDFLV